MELILEISVSDNHIPPIIGHCRFKWSTSNRPATGCILVCTPCCVKKTKVYFSVCKLIFHFLVSSYGTNLECIMVVMKLEASHFNPSTLLQFFIIIVTPPMILLHFFNRQIWERSFLTHPKRVYILFPGAIIGWSQWWYFFYCLYWSHWLKFIFYHLPLVFYIVVSVQHSLYPMSLQPK